MMKAWFVSDSYCEYSTVVFAETRNKAKVAAMATDCCEDMEYTEVRPLRFKAADTMYRGLIEMDWDNVNDRLFLVDHGWSCVEPDLIEECEDCFAHDRCDKYKDFVREIEEDEP